MGLGHGWGWSFWGLGMGNQLSVTITNYKLPLHRLAFDLKLRSQLVSLVLELGLANQLQF